MEGKQICTELIFQALLSLCDLCLCSASMGWGTEPLPLHSGHQWGENELLQPDEMTWGDLSAAILGRALSKCIRGTFSGTWLAGNSAPVFLKCWCCCIWVNLLMSKSGSSRGVLAEKSPPQ